MARTNRQQRRQAARDQARVAHREASKPKQEIDFEAINRGLNRWEISEQRVAELDQELEKKQWLFIIQSYMFQNDDGSIQNNTLQRIKASSENEARDIAAWHMPARPYHRILEIQEIPE